MKFRSSPLQHYFWQNVSSPHKRVRQSTGRRQAQVLCPAAISLRPCVYFRKHGGGSDVTTKSPREMSAGSTRGAIIQHEWHESQEGREFFSILLRRNRRKMFGLLEMPAVPLQVSPDVCSYKVMLTGKPGIGKTSTVAKLCGQEIPPIHVETPGIQTSVIYWPAKLKESGRVVMFRFEFWDCGDHALSKYDHLLPSCKNKLDAVLFLFSFTDRASFNDLPNQINRFLEGLDHVLPVAVATRLDQILHSDVTDLELREFGEQWNVPVLKIANLNGPHLADGRGLDGRANLEEVTPLLNTLAELLWSHSNSGTIRPRSRIVRSSPGPRRPPSAPDDIHFV